MSVLTHAPSLPPTTNASTMLVIGEASHYHFYQSLNHHVSQHPQHRSSKYRPTTKKIIPSVPRQHCKAPANSPLSFIRQQKLPHPTAMIPSSSCVDLLSTNTLEKSTSAVVPRVDTLSRQRSQSGTLDGLPNLRPRPRKVSFNDKVMVICTRFDDESNEENQNVSPTKDPTFMHGRRHSTGERIFPDDHRRQQRWLTFVHSLKHWKTTSYASPSFA